MTSFSGRSVDLNIQTSNECYAAGIFTGSGYFGLAYLAEDLRTIVEILKGYFKSITGLRIVWISLLSIEGSTKNRVRGIGGAYEVIQWVKRILDWLIQQKKTCLGLHSVMARYLMLFSGLRLVWISLPSREDLLRLVIEILTRHRTLFS